MRLVNVVMAILTPWTNLIFSKYEQKKRNNTQYTADNDRLN